VALAFATLCPQPVEADMVADRIRSIDGLRVRRPSALSGIIDYFDGSYGLRRLGAAGERWHLSENPLGVMRRKSACFDWDRSADHIRARSQNGCIQRSDTWLHPNASLRGLLFLLHGGRRPYMTRCGHKPGRNPALQQALDLSIVSVALFLKRPDLGIRAAVIT
jgi:hypothetical protein